MKFCTFTKVDGEWFCPGCSFRWSGPEPPIKECYNAETDPRDDIPPGTSQGRIVLKGPGDHLHDAILRWVGESPTSGCQCTSRIAQMNAWGPAGCREHLDEIVGWLVEEATNRGWWKFAVSVHGSRYFIKRMVLSAIKKAAITSARCNGW